MSNKEEFKLFVKSHPELIRYVKNGEMTWQKFYETYYSSNGNYAYDVNGRDLYVYGSDQVYYSSNNGVRPVIEVSKANIDY